MTTEAQNCSVDIDSQAWDKIRILVVDDMPEALLGRRQAVATKLPLMGAKFRKCFEFRWLATPTECRDFHDLSARLALLNPAILNKSGWIPEILALDYALTQIRQSVSERIGNNSSLLAELSPLPELQACAMDLFPKRESLPDDPCPVSALAGSEFWGCFIGGLLLNTFADHPCGPVTITRYTRDQLKTNAPDAAMFEWLMKWQSSDLLRASGKGYSPPWDEIITPGVKALRHRIVELAKASVIDLALDDVLTLTSPSRGHSTLTITSRFGRRRYPVEGLFVDAAPNGAHKAASKWARTLLRNAWWAITKNARTSMFTKSLSEIRQAWKASCELWDAYDSDRLDKHFNARMRLSELIVCADRVGGLARLGSKGKKELRGLMRTFGVTTINDSGCSKSVWDIREYPYGQVVQRWIVLFSLVRLLHRRYEALHRTHPLPKEVLPDDQLSLGKPIDVDDLYLVIFPVAKNPLRLPYDANDPGKAKNSWQQYLSRLEISVKDLLVGNGFGAGERMMLRMFAAAIGYAWRSDDNPQAIHVLRGP